MMTDKRSTSLPIFNRHGVVKCPKCGYADAATSFSARYCNGKTNIIMPIPPHQVIVKPCKDAEEAKVRGEHLHVGCPECNYWMMYRPSDWPDLEDPCGTCEDPDTDDDGFVPYDDTTEFDGDEPSEENE